MRGALPEKRTGLLFTEIKISSTCHLRVYLQSYMSAFCIIVYQEAGFCGYILLVVLHVTLLYSYMYVQYIQDLCQSRLGIDHAQTHVAHVTTAA
jgi:hypothetical protein